jgi:acyl-CoA synthetase (AMP-forming)/AMP-acid ligase II
MSDRVTWVDCPRCADRAALGWQTVTDGKGSSREDIVEFDCISGCRPTDVEILMTGATDDDGEAVLTAFVLRQPGADLTAAEAIEFVARRVAPYSDVRRTEFLDVSPKSASGKILPKDLRSPTQ